MDTAKPVQEQLDELEARLQTLAAEKDRDVTLLRKHIERLEQRLKEAETPEATPGSI